MPNPITISLPKKISLIQMPGYIHITRKWFGIQFVIGTFFAFYLDYTIATIYAEKIKSPSWEQLLNPIPGAIIALAMSYIVLAGWLNKTHIFVSKNTIEVKHGPVLWPGNKKLPASEIIQLYTKEKTSNEGPGETRWASYEVYAILRHGKPVKLLKGLESSDQALYIEQEIEKYLGIENKEVDSSLG